MRETKLNPDYQVELHNDVLKGLERKGVDKSIFWLIETQDIETATKCYPWLIDEEKYLIEEKGYDGIIYYHENGYICQHALFVIGDYGSLNDAINYLAENL